MLQIQLFPFFRNIDSNAIFTPEKSVKVHSLILFYWFINAWMHISSTSIETPQTLAIFCHWMLHAFKLRLNKPKINVVKIKRGQKNSLTARRCTATSSTLLTCVYLCCDSLLYSSLLTIPYNGIFFHSNLSPFLLHNVISLM